MSLLFKITGLAVIFCVCAMGGFYKSRTIRKRAQRLSAVYRSITVLAERIKTGAGEIGVICRCVLKKVRCICRTVKFVLTAVFWKRAI